MKQYVEKYFLKHPTLGEKEVTREEFISAERDAGHHPKSGNPNDLATSGFGSRFGITGSIRMVEEGKTEVSHEKSNWLDAQVSALQIQQGTEVVLRLTQDTPANTDRQMGEELRKAVQFGNLILVLPNGQDIEALDEAQMGELGWVRQSVVDEVVSALESLILFTKPSKSNAVALNNAHAVIASAKGGV